MDGYCTNRKGISETWCSLVISVNVETYGNFGTGLPRNDGVFRGLALATESAKGLHFLYEGVLGLGLAILHVSTLEEKTLGLDKSEEREEPQGDWQTLVRQQRS
jgi:hypothetical protein